MKWYKRAANHFEKGMRNFGPYIQRGMRDPQQILQAYQNDVYGPPERRMAAVQAWNETYEKLAAIKGLPPIVVGMGTKKDSYSWAAMAKAFGDLFKTTPQIASALGIAQGDFNKGGRMFFPKEMAYPNGYAAGLSTVQATIEALKGSSQHQYQSEFYPKVEDPSGFRPLIDPSTIPSGPRRENQPYGPGKAQRAPMQNWDSMRAKDQSAGSL
jgi:hypothetical protein